MDLIKSEISAILTSVVLISILVISILLYVYNSSKMKAKKEGSAENDQYSIK